MQYSPPGLVSSFITWPICLDEMYYSLYQCLSKSFLIKDVNEVVEMWLQSRETVTYKPEYISARLLSQQGTMKVRKTHSAPLFNWVVNSRLLHITLCHATASGGAGASRQWDPRTLTHSLRTPTPFPFHRISKRNSLDGNDGTRRDVFEAAYEGKSVNTKRVTNSLINIQSSDLTRFHLPANKYPLDGR